MSDTGRNSVTSGAVGRVTAQDIIEDAMSTYNEIARLQDANKQLLAFVDSVVSINPFSETIEPRNWLIDVCKQAATLLASLSTDTP